LACAWRCLVSGIASIRGAAAAFRALARIRRARRKRARRTISVNKYELVERYEALGEDADFVAAKRLFERDLTDQSSALDRRQYGYLLECNGRYMIGRAVEQY
jgi:hypothetical protein